MKRKDFFKKGFGAAVATTLIPNPWLSAESSEDTQNTNLNRVLSDKNSTPNPANFPVYSHLENPLSEDWKKVRKLFPIDPKLTFLNNGTMGITPAPVLKSLQDAFQHAAAQAAYPHADGSLEKMIAELTGVDESEIAITKNVSEGVNLACWAMDLKTGDEILITKHEHVGGCAPWLYRAQVQGIKLIVVELGDTATATLNNFLAATTPATKAIAIPHIPCTIGQVLPVKEICAWAKTKGIITAIDGAHPLGMIQFNIKEIGCDYYSGCLHKWALGPLGTGWFYASKEILPKSGIRHVAAYSVDKFDMSTVPPSMGELVNKTGRYSFGTFSGPLYTGAKTALSFYKHLGPNSVETRVKYLSSKVYYELLSINHDIAIKKNANKGKMWDVQDAEISKPPFSFWLNAVFGPQPWINTMKSATPAQKPNEIQLFFWKSWGDMLKKYNAETHADLEKNSIVLDILTPWHLDARGGQVSFRIAPETSPSLSQKFCNFARSKGMILRYVGENNIDCVRVSTHYYNNEAEIDTFVKYLREFLASENLI